ncbi:hypothetical protein [Flavobacterium cellulosilyticum]|uniref:Uncharacterized protein n=1 Tax=Flavobacterium cellulosilyticum TaxID=2541731 RepID=A0A4R5CHC0_9FLAO|nr:hypothetical protein [Flavobacterium cellulosilyticum]TDD98436.1 hypothetical protein E0F76_04680 [Flavobacterium cellulosilyticum]
MKAANNGTIGDTSLDTLNKNKDRIASRTSNSKCHKEVAMSYHEASTRLEQEYYNKASGCSVKAQEDNLFDYKFGIKY